MSKAASEFRRFQLRSRIFNYVYLRRKGVLLLPSEIGGRCTIFINDDKLLDRKESARFPEIKELKQMIRDIVSPGKDVGHFDKK